MGRCLHVDFVLFLAMAFSKALFLACRKNCERERIFQTAEFRTQTDQPHDFPPASLPGPSSPSN